jgi:hypothetical protein
MDNNELSLRDTARGIALRAGILTVGGVIVGGILAAQAMKLAGTMMKVSAATGLVLVGGAAAAWEVKRMKRHLSAPPSRPALV